MIIDFCCLHLGLVTTISQQTDVQLYLEKMEFLTPLDIINLTYQLNAEKSYFIFTSIEFLHSTKDANGNSFIKKEVS